MNDKLRSQAWRAHDNDTDELLFLEHLANLARDKTPIVASNRKGWKHITDRLRAKSGSRANA